MSTTNLIWWAIAGTLLSLLVGVAGTLLALGDGGSVAGSVMIGAGAAGGAAGLWIAGTAAVCSTLKRDRGSDPEA
ncbi:hypothetical protein ACFYSC_08635 [Streptosporangium sp. NPDC004379]|uniref:hypothetical protein n=1 Tax=Streptosporangium sp. NPDC004379 TaxID=3366189 RepID=UPI0036A5667F